MTTDFSVQLGTPRLSKVPGKKHHYLCVPLLDEQGNALDLVMGATRYEDGVFHKFHLGLVNGDAWPTRTLCRGRPDAARGPQWEWAATLLGQGQVPLSRPGHPQDSLMDLLAQSFKQFVQALDQSADMTFRHTDWCIPLAATRLLMVGWPLTSTARATFQEAIELFDTLPQRLHGDPRMITEGPRGARIATLEDDREVPLQAYYQTDAAWRALTPDMMIPPLLRSQAAPPSPRPSRSP